MVVSTIFSSDSSEWKESKFHGHDLLEVDDHFFFRFTQNGLLYNISCDIINAVSSRN